MQRVSAVPVLAAMAAVFFLSCLVACGGGSTADTTATQLILSPTTFSLNQGAVGTLSVTAENSAGTIVPADITFTSSNSSVATVSTGGLICAGQWDSVFINCTANGGVGQVTITATSNNNITGTATVYVHEQVDQVQAVLTNGCTSMGQAVGISGQAFSTTAPGCSPSAPCNITSTVGPFAFGSNDTSPLSPAHPASCRLSIRRRTAPPILPVEPSAALPAKPAICRTSLASPAPQQPSR